MINVILHEAEFFARHGFYPEEQLLGSKFLVNLSVGFTPASELNADDLTNTINYEIVTRIASRVPRIYQLR